MTPSADELDLVTGDPTRVTPETERRRRRQRGTATEGTTSTRGSKTTEEKVEANIRARLDQLFDRIVKGRRAVDDEELADVIEEDAAEMAQGFVSLTETVPFLRAPLILLLNIILPILAFSRVGRILFMRAIARRARQAEEHAAEVAEWERQNGVVNPQYAET